MVNRSRADTIEVIGGLHPGEIEGLSLAIQLRADLVLIDDRRAYRAALARNLNAVGTIRILERAAAAGILDLASAFELVKQTDFWISRKLLDDRLKLFAQEQKKKE